MLKEAEYCEKVKKDYFNQFMSLASREEKNLKQLQIITFVKNTLLRRTAESEIIVKSQENIEAQLTIIVIEALD